MSASPTNIEVTTTLTYDQKRRLESAAMYRRISQEEFIRICILDGCFAIEQKRRGEEHARS